MHVARSNEIKLEYGVAQKFALKFATGKAVQSSFPGGRVMFTAVDERKLFLNDEDANDFERGVRDLGIVAGEDFVRVTKVRHPRGGGHSLRVERVEDDTSQDVSGRLGTSQPVQSRVAQPAQTPAEPAQLAITPASAQMCAAMCAAVDAIIETQAYASRRGLGVTFSEESVRAIGLSIYIGAARASR
jgi:hypothetical protein